MSLILDGTNGETFPTWTTATRPASPNTNQLGYNSTFKNYELWNGSAWTGIMIASNMPAFYAYQSGSAQSVSANTFTKITMNSVLFDTNSYFDATTNYRFTPQIAGYYQITVGVGTTTPLATSIYYNAIIAKNGSETIKTVVFGSPANYLTAQATGLVYLNGSTDYVEAYGQSNSAYTVWVQTASTFICGVLVRSA
jgi:hypothetical protein